MKFPLQLQYELTLDDTRKVFDLVYGCLLYTSPSTTSSKTSRNKAFSEIPPPLPQPWKNRLGGKIPSLFPSYIIIGEKKRGARRKFPETPHIFPT